MRKPVALPRLLPTTVAALGLLLVAKSADLARAVLPAQAAEPAAATQADPVPPPSPVPAKAGVSQAGAAAAPPVAPAQPATAAPPVSDSERAVLLELRQRRQELDGREAALGAREAVMAAAEQKLARRVDELQALQARLEALEAARRARDGAHWQGMVKLYEAMKPRDAAAIFNDLDMAVLLEVVDRMKEARAAAVLAAMQPEKARQVTTGLAQLRTRANADPAAAAAGG